MHFKDNTKARIINRQQNNRYVQQGSKDKVRSQIAIYDYLQEQEFLDQQALIKLTNVRSESTIDNDTFKNHE